MCGIVGYIGGSPSWEVILEGLRRLEYRGYDSAGIATVHDGALRKMKSLGKLGTLSEQLGEAGLPGTLGIGHTRWATHGMPSEENAHPHLDGPGEIAVVHNGIIENHQDLRQALEAEGVEFQSETDSEVLPHLVRKYYDGDLFAAVQRALQDVSGAYAIGVVCAAEPDLLVGARQGSPLVIGVGEDCGYIASDVPALLPYTNDILYLEEGQVCAVRRDGCVIVDSLGTAQEIEVVTVALDAAAAEKDGFPHYMLKEIHQQPAVVEHLLLSYVGHHGGDLKFPDLNLSEDTLRGLRRIVIVACGTAWHAGLTDVEMWDDRLKEIEKTKELNKIFANDPQNILSI